MTRNYRAPESACRSWRRFYHELKALDFRLSEQIYLERDVLRAKLAQNNREAELFRELAANEQAEARLQSRDIGRLEMY